MTESKTEKYVTRIRLLFLYTLQQKEIGAMTARNIKINQFGNIMAIAELSCFVMYLLAACHGLAHATSRIQPVLAIGHCLNRLDFFE